MVFEIPILTLPEEPVLARSLAWQRAMVPSFSSAKLCAALRGPILSTDERTNDERCPGVMYELARAARVPELSREIN